MHWALAKDAIEKGVCVELVYDGFRRVVEVHAVGESAKGQIVMRVWQVEGGSNSGGGSNWKLLRLDEVISASLSSKRSDAPRDGYKRGDRNMRVIFTQL